MTFAAPWALLGLLCAAIPLLLHLFARREPPTVIFPATRYPGTAAECPVAPGAVTTASRS